MKSFGLVDGIVREPLGGAHNAPETMAETLKNHIKASLAEVMPLDADERIRLRIQKYRKMGQYKEL